MSTPVPRGESDVTPYDALLLVSFGGPEQADEVMPFLRRVTAGRGVPDDRLAEVAEHYFEMGGRSPINDQNRALLSAIREDLAAAGIDIPVYWGNRNSEPFLPDVVARMAADGHRRVACFVTAAYSSWSSCRQYRENLIDAAAAVERAPQLDVLRAYWDHEGFVESFVSATLASLANLPSEQRDEAHLAFVTHSISTAMNAASADHTGAYQAQHEALVTMIRTRIWEETGRRHPVALAYCSRSGSPEVPWLEPDINDHLADIAKAGEKAVVVVPIGFVSDHMEVAYDLDTEAAETAAELGLTFERADTPGVDPRFVALVRDLLLERAEAERGGTGTEDSPVWQGPSCAGNCCIAGMSRPE